MTFLKNIQRILSENIREYGMWIALFAVMAIFEYTTKGLFLSPRNISVLFIQTGYIAVLAVGMTLVIVIRWIDLSVGFLAGFLGAIAAILMVNYNVPTFPTILIVLLLGTIAGLLTGFLVAQLKIPAFVATLAGWLIYRGAILVATESSGTIIIPNDDFNAIGNGYLPDVVRTFMQWIGINTEGFLPSMHLLTIALGVLAIVFLIIGQINDRRKKQSYNFEVLSLDMFLLKILFISGLIGAIVWTLAAYQGLSWTVVIVVVVVGIYHFITTETVLGRHIYAIGGNPEAAELSGVSIKQITYIVFGSMGLLSALSGIMFASRLQSATQTAGSLFELDAIAAAFVGGASAAGGVGKVMGSIIGALLMMSLTSGMNLMSVGVQWQYVFRGAVLALAVVFDVATRNRAK
jgi:putative multiple sugar transport system permease protein